jgi:hypothetical protein
MKKLLIFALVLGLVAGALSMPASAKKKKKKPKRVERTAEGQYTGAAAGLYGNVGGNTIGGFSFATGSEEKYVKVEVTDATGTTISGSVGQDPDGDMQTDEKGTYCGATEEPIQIEPGVDIVVYVDQGTCNGGPSVVTQGTIKVTLSNLP